MKTFLIAAALFAGLMPSVSHAAAALGTGRNYSNKGINASSFGWPSSQQPQAKKPKKARKQ